MQSLMSWEESSMVEWKKLGEVCTLERGVRVVRKNLQESGPIPVFQNSLTPLGFFEKSNYPANIPFVICAGAAGEIGFSNGPFWAADDCTCILCKSSTISKFAYYYLLVKQHSLKSQVRKASVPRLSKNTIDNLIIPIPSIAEQKRIVGILDTFTASIDNLKEQISQRRKQFECYRDQLLDLEGKEGVEMKTLEDCAILISDGDHQPPPKTQQGIPFITISNINKDNHKIDFSNTYYVPKEYYESIKNERKAKEGDVLYTVTGSYGIPVNIDFTKEFCFQRHIAMIRPNIDVLLSKFLYHSLLTMGVKKQADENASGGAQKTVSLSSLRKFIIYVPPTSEQQRIVSILDTFEESISNLEAQLEQRQKQYEYYRNKLLTFD